MLQRRPETVVELGARVEHYREREQAEGEPHRPARGTTGGHELAQPEHVGTGQKHGRNCNSRREPESPHEQPERALVLGVACVVVGELLRRRGRPDVEAGGHHRVPHRGDVGSPRTVLDREAVSSGVDDGGVHARHRFHRLLQATHPACTPQPTEVQAPPSHAPADLYALCLDGPHQFLDSGHAGIEHHHRALRHRVHDRVTHARDALNASGERRGRSGAGQTADRQLDALELQALRPRCDSLCRGRQHGVP